MEKEFPEDMPGPSHSTAHWAQPSPPITPSTSLTEEHVRKKTAMVTTGHNPNGIRRGIRKKLIREKNTVTTPPILDRTREHEKSEVSGWRVDATVMTTPQFEGVRLDIQENPEGITSIGEDGNVNLENNIKSELTGKGEG